MASHPSFPPASLALWFLPLLFASHLCAANVIHPNTALTPSSSSLWTSPNGTFSMGFFSFIPNSYYVGIWYSSLPSNQSIVWTANRDQSVPSESALHFTPDGRLVLTANSSTTSQTVWAASVSGASQAELLDTGNIVLRDNTSSVVWQNFDHPTDTLLPDQNFTFSSDNSLVPWISSTDPSPSTKYSLVFGRTGGPIGRIRLMSQNTDEYWSEPSPSVTDVLFNTTFTMDASGTLRLFNGTGTLEWFNTSCDGTVPTNSIKKLQLGTDGNLRVLAWSDATKTWNTLWRALYIQCDVFNTCGENSICNLNVATASVGGGGCPFPEAQQQQICSCPEGFTRNGSICNPPASLNCSGYMATLEQLSFGAPNQAPTISPVTLQECRDTCLNDCNCTAASSNASSCWLYNTALYNGVRSTTKDRTSFIKTISSNSTGSSSSALPSYAIALVVIAISLLVFLLLAALFKRHRVRSRHPRFKDVFLNLDELNGPKRFSSDDLYMVTGGFHEKNKLGAGGFGTVFKGTFITDHGKLDAAIKRLNHVERHGYTDYSSENSDFMAEITILGCIKHVNVVNLVGFCAQGPERLLVYEFVAKGSLSRHLFSNSAILSWNQRFQIAVDAATGIEYLHAHCPKKIVHRDIKPDNILLDENFRAKVADFGVSQIMGPDRTHFTNNTLRGTPTYMAPECWQVGALVTEKADAYSYGVVLLEIVSGKMVTRSAYVKEEAEVKGKKGEKLGGEQDDELQNLKESENSSRKSIALPLEHALQAMEVGRWESLVDERLQGVYNTKDAKHLIRIVFWCLQGNPEQRPSMEDLLLMIKGHKDVPPPPIHGLFDIPLRPMFPSSPRASASILPESLSQGR